MKEGSVFTFYSYKGGVGRTLALANIGALLSRWGYKVLCIDWDLEAPGLHFYFQKWIKQKRKHGLVELIQSHVDGKNPSWRRHVTQVNFPKAKQPLSLISAGHQDKTYVRRMQNLDWAKLYDEHDLGMFVEELREKWKKAFDFVLVDSRTGITDIGGICTVQLPDYLVLLFTPNEQSLLGSLDVIERARDTRNSFPFDRAKPLVLPVATRFETRVEYKEAQRWLTIFEKALTPLYAEWIHRDITAADMLNHTRVPSIPYWSFGERLPVIEKGTGDPEDIGYSLETLAALVAQKLAFSDALVKNRDSYVAAAKKGPLASSAGKGLGITSSITPSARIYISYSHQDLPFVNELFKHLTSLTRQGVIELLNAGPIPAGANWESAINPNMQEADIILLLVSSDYLASDYSYDVEMKLALDLHSKGKASVIPIILRPTNWADSPLANLQVLPPNGVSIITWKNQDEAWLEVIKGIRTAINALPQIRGTP